MEPLLLLLGGLILLSGAVALLRSFGEAFRVARLLQTTRRVTLADAVRLARDGEQVYVRVSGRIDSDDAFPDEHRRPLVFRRSRLQVRRRGRWVTVEERREAVRFQLQQGLDAVAIRDADLDAGLVVIPRESSGAAGEVPEGLPADVDPSARVRLRVEPVSAVEHATVLGVPRATSDGSVTMTAGAGRPLVVSTLEDAEAMRILAADAPRRPLLIAGLLVAGLGMVALATAWLAVRAFVA